MTRFQLRIRALVQRELDAAQAAEALGHFTTAFRHLERAHVLGQPFTREHVRVHWRMFRFALRNPSGEILSSTYFSVEPTVGRDGRIAQLTLRGTGYGHGVGMCQWGAIGRARAGQDYRRILNAYYPGAVIQRVD